MKNLLCLLLTAGICSAQIPVTWEVETTRALAKEVEAYQGETLIFRPAFVEYGAAVSTNGLVWSFVWQTNGMASTWWTTNGTVWRPTMDVGANRYTFFIRAEGTGGVNYRANGTLKVKASPGFMPNVLPAPGVLSGLSSNDVAVMIGAHNGSGSAHPDIRTQIGGVSNLARTAYNLANERPTQDDVRDIIAENANSFMIGEDVVYGSERAYKIQNEWLFFPKFYYDEDGTTKWYQLGMSSTTLFFANQNAQYIHLKPDGIAYNGNQSIKWPLAESVSEGSPRTFATREWTTDAISTHRAETSPHTNSVAWYLRDLGTNGLLVVVASNSVFSVFQVKE